METSFEQDGDTSTFIAHARELKADDSPAIGAAGTLTFSADTVGVVVGFTAHLTLTSPASRETIEAAILAWAHALVSNVGTQLVEQIVRVENETSAPTDTIVH